MVNHKLEPVSVSVQDGHSASPSSAGMEHDDVQPESASGAPLVGLRRELLDAVVVQQEERIRQLERQLEKKIARVEQFSAQLPFMHPSAIAMPPGLPGAASSATAQKVMDSASTVGSAIPKTPTVGAPSQPAPAHHPAVAAAMAAAAAAGNPHVSGALPAQYPFVYSTDHPVLAATSMMGVVPHRPTPSPALAQPATAPQTSQPVHSDDGDRKQSRYWTPDEHQRFLAAVNTCGPKNYNQISEFVGTRNAKQVRTHAQKFQKRLEREEAKRREMRLPAGERGGSHVGAAAVAAVVAGAAAAMDGNVPGVSSGMHQSGGPAYGGPTSSSSGKNFAHHDQRGHTRAGSSVDGSSSTNDLSGSASGSGERNVANDSDNTGDHSATNAADAAAAAVAAEAVALGGGMLQCGGIPGVMITKPEPATKPDIQRNEINPPRGPKESKTDAQNGAKRDTSASGACEINSDARTSSVSTPNAVKGLKVGSDNADDVSKTPASGSPTSTQQSTEANTQPKDNCEGKNVSAQEPPPKVRFKATAMNDGEDGNLESAKANSATVNTEESPLTTAELPQKDDADVVVPSSKEEDRTPESSPKKAPSQESAIMPSETKEMQSTSPEDEGTPSARQSIESPISKAKGHCSSVQKRILAKYNEQAKRSLERESKMDSSGADIHVRDRSSIEISRQELANGSDAKEGSSLKGIDHKKMPMIGTGNVARTSRGVTEDGGVSNEKLKEDPRVPSSSQGVERGSEMTDDQHNRNESNSLRSKTAAHASGMSAEKAKGKSSVCRTSPKKAHQELNEAEMKQAREQVKATVKVEDAVADACSKGTGEISGPPSQVQVVNFSKDAGQHVVNEKGNGQEGKVESTGLDAGKGHVLNASGFEKADRSECSRTTRGKHMADVVKKGKLDEGDHMTTQAASKPQCDISVRVIAKGSGRVDTPSGTASHVTRPDVEAEGVAGKKRSLATMAIDVKGVSEREVEVGVKRARGSDSVVGAGGGGKEVGKG